MTELSIQFDLNKEQVSIIKVIGVGGGGSNAVNHMYRQGIIGVDFMVCNTDQQALDLSPVNTKLVLGHSLTEGRGAGMDPEIGKKAAMESYDVIKELLSRGTKMVFITAGMGKGTGTGGAPVIAKAARELGILTVGLVTTPFMAEGPKRLKQAKEGIEELRNFVDSILIISNDKLRMIHGNLALSSAFNQADSILTNAAKSIAEIITVAGYVNVDFNDVNTVMRNSGVAIMGTAVAEGENRAILAVEEALNSPLLNDNDIKGAKNILLNITSGKIEVTLDEISEIQDYIQSKAGSDTNIIWGNCYNEALGDKLSVTVIATGFESIDPIRQVKKTVTPLTTEKNTGTVHTEIKSDVHQASQQPTSTSVSSHKTQVQPELELPLTIQTKSVQDVELIQHNDVELSINITELTEESHHIHAEAGTQIKFTTSTTPSNTIPINEDASQAQNLSRAKNDRLKSMNYNGYRSNSVYDKENTPAYLRKNIKLNEPPHSSDSSMSQMYIDMPDANGRGSVEIKKNNFLHGRDKVD